MSQKQVYGGVWNYGKFLVKFCLLEFVFKSYRFAKHLIFLTNQPGKQKFSEADSIAPQPAFNYSK